MSQPKYLWNCWQKSQSDGGTWKQDLCCAWPKKTICKSECIVADSTDSIKLVLWESIIDKVNAGNSYKFQNVTIRLFDDERFLNTNKDTIVTEIPILPDVNLEI